MSLTSLCLWIAAFWLGLGLVTGAIIQIEMSAPGIWIEQALGLEGAAAKQLYMWSITLHGAALISALPLTMCVAYPAALLAKNKHSAIWRVVSVIFLGLSVVIFLWFIWPRDPFYLASDKNADSILIAIIILLSFIGTLSLLGLKVTSRSGAIAYIMATLGMLIITGLVLYINFSTIVGTGLSGTYVEVSVRHGYGGILTLLMLSVLASRAAMIGRALSLGPALLLAAGSLGTGVMMVRSANVLGFRGMLRGYIDYPDEFRFGHHDMAVWSSAFALIAVIAIIILIRQSRLRAPAAADVFS